MIDNLLHWLQQHIKHWTKPATAVLISWSSRRCNSQPFGSDRGECSAAPATNRPASADQTTSAIQSRALPVRASCPPYQILETIHSYCSTGNSAPLASGIVSCVLAAEVAGPAEDFGRNHWADPKDGYRKSLVGSGTDPWGTIEVGDGSEQTNDPEIPAERAEVAFFEPDLGYLHKESSQWHLGLRLYGSV